MARNRPKYTLQFIFDAKLGTMEQLREQAQEILKPHLRYIQLSVTAMRFGPDWLLTMTGSLTTIDACHAKIIDKLLPKYKYNAVRWTDDASEKIRRDVYPIVARIEQGLRRFISRAMLEVGGIEWWEQWGPEKHKATVEEMRKREKDYYKSLHPIEILQFRELIELIMAKVTKWGDSTVSAMDILELIRSVKSFDELTIAIEERMKVVSLWEDVFAKYFTDETQWKEIAGTLRFVVNERHKAMHHQPMRLRIVAALQEAEKKIEAVLQTAKGSLEAEELREASESLRYFDEAIMATRRAFHSESLDDNWRASLWEDWLGPNLAEWEKIANLGEAQKLLGFIEDNSALDAIGKAQDQIDQLSRLGVLDTVSKVHDDIYGTSFLEMQDKWDSVRALDAEYKAQRRFADIWDSNHLLEADRRAANLEQRRGVIGEPRREMQQLDTSHDRGAGRSEEQAPTESDSITDGDDPN